MPRLIDLTGQRYGRLTAIKRSGLKTGRVAWLCQCDCGNQIVTTSNLLRTGHTKSCGCLSNEKRAERAHVAGAARGAQMKKHGKTGTRLYGVWKSMRGRCANKHNKYYEDYGGRGITVCEEWNDFQNFYDWAMSAGYQPDAPFGMSSLDRIDNEKGYSPSNCRWVDMVTQANNRRKRRYYRREDNQRKTG